MTDKQGWTGGPSTRGTFDILWTCVSTLALCVWTAVHPNIPLLPSTKSSLLTRIGMMIVAIVFPEVIISSAWRQLRSSQWLRKEINRIAQNRQDNYAQYKALRGHYSPHTPRPTDDQSSQKALLPTFEFETVSGDTAFSPSTSYPIIDLKTGGTKRALRDSEVESKSLVWNSEQAFFAVMGGFAIENEYLDEKNIKVTLRRILTVNGVLQLAKLGLMPVIDPEDISERSKADNIAKIFVLSQIIWFALQVIGRLASKIPVTPLEIHTAVHVACTIIMYLLWMKKPYDVRGSVPLNNPDAKDIAALCNFYTIAAKLHAEAYIKYENARVAYWKDRVVRAANNLLDHDPPPNPPIKEVLTSSVHRYLSYATELHTSSKNAEEHVLVALAPSAQRGIEILRKHGHSSDHSINDLKWNLL
ncbi:uncharacterized protein LY89DRAFT_675297 [Mollisia scopiformis]|uniref:Uncharacterized protein n=1 Tax=Mollisia scopiformis TaxID=149040 RepID=A0A132BDG3_MOLSC|nr:uncharacterized protein LY89DRAFT_675297 [Mollisia scopiformis]KUJ10470.1 hypothetical protein LY89DRAFT_675297 [Mollisia scopiformis]